MVPGGTTYSFKKSLAHRTLLRSVPPRVQNFYLEHPAVQARPDSHAEGWRAEHSITVQGSGIPKPW